MEQLLLPPIAGAFIQSLRSVGYSMESAVADLIDNSISAKASSVDIFTDWRNTDPILAVMDNGHGMAPCDVQTAMQLGSISPIDERERNDLGRFGMGLKTASFSQCKKLILISRNCDTENWYGICWDLDLVAKANRWVVGVLSLEDCEQYIAYIGFKYQYGTAVIWCNFDRAIDLTATNSEQNFTKQINSLINHLELTFHRFIDGDNVPKKVSISINNRYIQSRDPFAIYPEVNKQGSTILSEETLKLDHCSIFIKAYVLPHPTNMSHLFASKVSLNGDHYAGQGLYIYRAGRLIASGGWYQLAKSSEANKLARVQIEFGNEADYLWHIDVKKSRVELPASLREPLRRIIKLCSEKSSVTFTRRAKMPSIDLEPVWQRIFNREKNRVHYSINRNHPIIIKILQEINCSQKKAALISLIETALPVELIKNDLSAVKIRLERNDDDSLSQCYKLIEKLNDAGINHDIIVKALLNDSNIKISREQVISIINKVSKNDDCKKKLD